MPTFELALLLKPLAKPELTAALKRTASAIFDEGGVLRKMDNLGIKQTPYKIAAHGARHLQAHYFIFNFDIGRQSKTPLLDNFKLDVDIIRCRINLVDNVKLKLKEEDECTLHYDLLPPPYRPSVQAMIEQGKKKEKPKFKYNSGMNYYPFQR